MHPDHENISLEPGESFRSFHWETSVDQITLHGGVKASPQAVITPKQSKGVGHLWHFHRAHEITCFTRGSGKRFVGDDINDFTCGEIVYLAPNLPHCWKAQGKSSGYSIQFERNQNAPLKTLPELSSIMPLLRQDPLGIVFDRTVTKQVLPLMQRLSQSSALQRLSCFLEIVDCLSTQPKNKWRTLSQNIFQLDQTDPAIAHIQKIIDYVIDHCDQDLTLDDIAQQFHISTSSLCRHVRKFTGKSFNQLVIELRLCQIKIKLVESNENVSAIAWAAGFNNLSSFNYLFKKNIGMTPKAYRQQYHNV